ncbi:hypothetical protein DNTS_027217 [Danionella cerebrum]|uniref:Cyclin-dependent kinase inhibitor 1B n=1 Tax=Danionella cerebrum TaxID=2873325 RepID=A0A553QNB4_9TELE|nr:hypothetical protein DNTS_027217 [Danionella translucida]
MSNVRLSNGSPTLERMEARLADQSKPSACRSLFGPVDHEELKRDFQRTMKAMADASAENWDFDFDTHTPRPGGRFQWEALDIRSVPGFYSRSERGKTASGVIDDVVDVNGNLDCPVTEETAETPETHREPRKRVACPGALVMPQQTRSHLYRRHDPDTPKTPKNKKTLEPHTNINTLSPQTDVFGSRTAFADLKPKCQHDLEYKWTDKIKHIKL